MDRWIETITDSGFRALPNLANLNIPLADANVLLIFACTRAYELAEIELDEEERVEAPLAAHFFERGRGYEHFQSKGGTRLLWPSDSGDL